jgi:methylthioribose-1-phosphate isomerase
MKYSLLFWPVNLIRNTIYILDETELPHKLVYLRARNYKQAAKIIKDMKTRGIGQVLLIFYTFLLAIRQNKNKQNLILLLKKIARAFNCVRPTLPFRFLTDIILDWAQKSSNLEKNILDFLKVLKNKRIQQAKVASSLISNEDVILTHCNISGLLPLIGEFCRQQRKEINFFVTETRPYLQGSRLTAWELKRAGFDVTIIPDSAVAFIFAKRLINKVIVGADHMAENGDIANKIGTYQIALLAKEFNIPFYCLCPPPSKAKTGEDISVEIRPEKELLIIYGKKIAPSGAKGYYPAFDITPASLITKHIPLEIWKR